MKKKILLLGFVTTLMFAEDGVQIKNDVNNIGNSPIPVQSQIPTPTVVTSSNNEDFSNSLANKINSKLETIDSQIKEAQAIKASSLNMPKGQMLEEKRIEQYLPIMSGGYTITTKVGVPLEKKALSIDEKGQKYYLSTSNNDVVQGIKEDYLVYKNSETNKPFKSPMALPNKTSGDLKVSSTENINSITPIVQNMTPLPPLKQAVQQEVNKLNNHQ